MTRIRRSLGVCLVAQAFSLCALLAQLTPEQKSANLESFEIVWKTVRDHHPDPELNGLDWQAVHDRTRPRIAGARSMDEVRSILRVMLAQLDTSHYSIIPAGDYPSAASSSSAGENSARDSGSPARNTPPGKFDPAVVDGKAAIKPVEPLPSAPSTERVETPHAATPGDLVTFANLPPMRVVFESRLLDGGAGYIRLNVFLDPAKVMPEFEAALKRFDTAPGVILDLRGNPGGIGIMAMGIAGFFVDRDGLKLGEMKMRGATLKFAVFPRPHPYRGKLAILVDEGSASTSEILAQGLRDLGRARIFGARTLGAALPSDIIRLPNGDRFQYAQASYVSEKGLVLERHGVIPDVEVNRTPANLDSGKDPALEAAARWIASN